MPHPPDELVEVRDAGRWNELVDRLPGKFATQLWEYGEVRRSLGWEPRRLALVDDGDLSQTVAAVQLLVRRMPVVRWGVGQAPRGPVGARSDGAAERFIAAMRDWARRERVSTLVLDPAVDEATEIGRMLMLPPWKAAPVVGEPLCHVLDFDDTDPWSRVRRKHREWIRRAEKAGIEVTWTGTGATDDEARAAIDRFVQVYFEVGRRVGIPLFKPHYYRLLWDEFRAAGRAELALASHAGEPVAAMLHIAYGDEYLWFAGGQTASGTPVGAGKLLMWRSILHARELGFRRYNMWGTATPTLAHYKEGFGARPEVYVGTRMAGLQRPADLVVQAAWRAKRLARELPARLRRQARGARPAGDPAG